MSAGAGAALTGVEAVAEAYDRIASDDARPAWISVLPRQDALRRARETDPSLPLAGVPFAVKDNIDVAGMPTTAACPGFAYVPQRTAPAVQLLLDAGAVLIGKTNLDQFATGLVGTRSPYGVVRSAVDPRFVAGGSSSGSAVVVADGTVAFALGTDTAGSGRVPAAFNGVVGLKPTRGRLSTRGVVPACRSLDCVSVFSRDVATAVTVLGVAGGPDGEDPWGRLPPGGPGVARSPDGLVVGVPGAAAVADLDDRLAEAWEAAIARARAVAATVVEVDVAAFCEAGELLYGGPWIAERWASLGSAVDAGLEGLDPIVEAILRRGRDVPAVEAFQAQHRLAELRVELRRAWGGVDAVLVPTAPTVPTPEDVEADPVALNRRLGRWTNGVNLLDLCALALPAGSGDDGMPFGVCLLAPAWHEADLIGLGQAWMGEAHEPVAEDDGRLLLAVAGAHLRGQPLERELLALGARFVSEERTAGDYRLVALPGGPPARPGLLRAPGGDGSGIELELVSLDPAALGALLAGVPAPLCIGTVTLADGRDVLGFLCEDHAAASATDITEFGGWRAYLAAVQA